MLYRYSRWDGSQSVDPFSADDLMDSLADDLMENGDVQDACMIFAGASGIDGSRTSNPAASAASCTTCASVATTASGLRSRSGSLWEATISPLSRSTTAARALTRENISAEHALAAKLLEAKPLRI